MKNVFIIGSRGYHYKHGGFERFVDNLIDNYDDPNTIFYISELTHIKKERYSPKKNVYVDYIKVGNWHNATMLIQTIKAFKYYVNYIEKQQMSNCVIYVLGLKLGPYLKWYRRKLKKLGIKVYFNPDGLEWKRSKWNFFIKHFFLLEERWMLNNCDLIICDSKGILDYINKKYPHNKVPKKYIAYGTIPVEIKESQEQKILNKYHLVPNQYFIIVCRFVPENNFELIIKEFMKTNINKELVIIGNIDNKKFYNKLLKRTHFDKDKRIRFLGPIYDMLGLTIIRTNAFGYLHGHSVGGTNPTLLESMLTVDLNILYDISFNREVGQDSCLYFSNKEGDLAKLLMNNKKLEKAKKELSKKAKAIIRKNFTWEYIVNEYKKIF